MNIKDYKKQQSSFFKKYWYINLIIIIVGFTIGIVQTIKSDNEEEEYAKRFPYYNSAYFISGIVVHIEKGRKMRRGEGVEFELNDTKGYTLGWADNYMYVPSKISDFIQIGDSINKRPGTDSVLVYRGNNLYYFVISKRIDKNGNFY